MTNLAVVDERAEWLAWRRQGVGASDIAAILGLSRHESPWSVWADKVGLLPLDDDGGQYRDERKFGRYAELMVAPWFHDETDLHVLGEQTWVQHPEEPWRRCTVDGFVAESPEAGLRDVLGLLQIKTRERGRRWEDVPADIQAQEQWEMHCTGMERAWVAVLMGRRLDIHVIERDQADIDFIVERVGAFWHDHVLTGDPPPTDGHEATLRALAAVYPHHVPDKSVPVDELADVIVGWGRAKGEKKAAEGREKAAAAAIQAALGDAEEGTIEGERFVSWRQQTRRGVDLDRLRADHSDLVAAYATESTFRVLRPHAPKRKAS